MMPKVLSSLILLCFMFFSPAQGSKFDTNCTIPSTETNYVSGPNTRGTTSILWNCLSIIILCTWSIQQLNVPPMRPQPNGWRQKIWWAILDSRTQIKWMVYTVFVPEYLMGKALGERLAASYGVKLFEHYRSSGLVWEEVHSYMANMGYFVLDFGDLLGARERERQEEEAMLKASSSTDKQPVVYNHATPSTGLPFETEVNYLLQSTNPRGAPFIQGYARINLERLRHRYWALNTTQLYHATLDIIEIPHISSRKLQELDRGEILAKVLALLQIMYLIAQLLWRKITKLPSAPIEVAILAFSVSSLVTYILYWNRPQGIKDIQIIKPKALPSMVRLAGVAESGPAYPWYMSRTKHAFEPELDLAPIPNDSIHLSEALKVPPLRKIVRAMGDNDETLVLTVGMILGGTLFGGLHCLAWNFHFPTIYEGLGWRVSCVVTAVLPPLSIIPTCLWMKVNPWGAGRKARPIVRLVVGTTIVVAFLVPYILARLFLIIECFRSLFFLPPEAFIDTWSGSLPHWG